jgi:phosphoglycerate dehydrogenase-like enzyme
MRILFHTTMPGFDLAAECAGIEAVDIITVATPAEMAAQAAGADALVLAVGGYTQEVAAAAQAPGSRVRWLQFLSAGVENAERFGIPAGCVLTNASAAWAPTVAEHAVSLLLALNRQVHLLERARLAHSWNRPALQPHLRSLEGAQIGILGYGAIGRGMAARLQGFGATIHGIARSPGPQPGADEMHHPDDLLALAPRLDALLSAIPLSAQTHHIVGDAILAALPRHAVIVNVGRGPTIDEAALARRLADGSLAGAALDVFETEPLPATSPLWDLPNVILSPHVAAMGSRAGWQRLGAICRGNLIRLLAGETLPDRVVLET